MLDKKDLLTLMKTVAKADSSAPTSYSWNGEGFSYEALNETLRRELNEYAGDYYAYNQNKYLIFQLIQETLDDILPKKVTKQYEQFAEVKQFRQGDKPLFKRKISSNKRAKQFITRVGLAGVYEVFKLGKNEETFEVPTSAIGGAGQVSIEEFLDGRVDFAEITAIIMEGIDDLIYEEIGASLATAIKQLPPANRVVADGFDEESFDKLINVAAAYGEPTIYCTNEFAVKLIPTEAWRYSDDMKNELWANGRLQSYKGRKVVVLEQGFQDETNSKKVIDPGYCWIIPSGANTKPVKIAMEGDTLIREVENADWSKEIQVYKKIGVVCMMTNDICSYVDSSLLGQMETWKLTATDSVKNTVTVDNIEEAGKNVEKTDVNP